MVVLVSSSGLPTAAGPKRPTNALARAQFRAQRLCLRVIRSQRQLPDGGVGVTGKTGFGTYFDQLRVVAGRGEAKGLGLGVGRPRADGGDDPGTRRCGTAD